MWTIHALVISECADNQKLNFCVLGAVKLARVRNILMRYCGDT